MLDSRSNKYFTNTYFYISLFGNHTLYLNLKMSHTLNIFKNIMYNLKNNCSHGKNANLSTIYSIKCM